MLAWKKANSSGVTCARQSMSKNQEEPLVSGSDPCMVARRNPETSVIQLQGNEFCQQQVCLETCPKPWMRVIVLADTMISAW